MCKKRTNSTQTFRTSIYLECLDTLESGIILVNTSRVFRLFGYHCEKEYSIFLLVWPWSIFMPRSQLNINIDPDLLSELKEKARTEGKTISAFTSEILSNTLKAHSNKPLGSQISELKNKINVLQTQINSITNVLPAYNKVTPFTEKEAENFSEFLKSIFEEYVSKKKFASKKEAFNQLLSHIACFSEWNQLYSLRLKEVLFIKDYDPFSISEMNSLTAFKKCHSPIRTALITWTKERSPGQCYCKDIDFPSLQEICDKGPILVNNLF